MEGVKNRQNEIGKNRGKKGECRLRLKKQRDAGKKGDRQADIGRNIRKKKLRGVRCRGKKLTKKRESKQLMTTAAFEQREQVVFV